MRALLTLGVSIVIAASGGCGDASSSDGAAEDDLSSAYKPHLQPVTADQAKQLVAAASQVTYAQTDAGTKPIGVAWAWIQENCNRRADMVDFAFSQGMTPALLPNPIPSALLTTAANKPAFQTARIYLTGPLNVQETYVVPGLGDVGKPSVASWDHHIAAVINVGGTLQVVDPSLTSAPLAIKDWIAAYIPAGMTCPQVTEKTYTTIDMYYIGRWQFAETKPKQACGYKLGPAYGLNAKEAATNAVVSEELEGARQLLEAGFTSLRTTLNDATHKNIADDVLPRVTSRIKPVTDADACKTADYAYKWCAEYRP